jgi:hypothetical protein
MLQSRLSGCLRLQGVFLGTVEEALALLQAGGMLNNLNRDYITSSDISDVSQQYPFGLRLKQADSIFDFYRQVSDS